MYRLRKIFSGRVSFAAPPPPPSEWSTIIHPLRPVEPNTGPRARPEQQGSRLPPGTARARGARRPPAAAPARLPGPDPSPARRSLGCRRKRAQSSAQRLTAKWRLQARESRARVRGWGRGLRATDWSGRGHREAWSGGGEGGIESGAFDAEGVAHLSGRGQTRGNGRIRVGVVRSVVEIHRFWLGSSLYCPASLSKSPLWPDFLF